MCISMLALISVSSIATSSQAWASSSSSPPAAPGLSPINPSPNGYFEYTIAPGSSTSGAFTVRNLTTSPTSYLIYVSDATTSPVSGVAYGQLETHPVGVPAWIKLSTGLLHLAPKGASTVHFSVTVPKGTASGDYVVGLVAQTQTPTKIVKATTSSKTSATLITTTRVIVAAVISVPGSVKPAASFGQPNIELQQHRRQLLAIPIHDTGNVLMKPYLAGKILSCSTGKTVLNIGRQLDTFVPHTSIDYPWYLNNRVVPAGCYRATFTLSNSGTVLASFNGTLHVAAATTKVVKSVSTSTQHPTVITRVRAGIPGWLIPAASVVALLLLVVIILLAKASRDRRKLLKQLKSGSPKAPSHRTKKK